MRNIYDLLNHSSVDCDDYNPVDLSGSEKERLKQHFHSSVHHSQQHTIRSCTVAAVCMSCVVALSQTAFAQSVVENIIQSINLGHSQVVQVSPHLQKEKTNLGTNEEKSEEKSVIKQQDIDNYTIQLKDLNQAVAKVNFKVRIPKNLSANYVFDHAELYKDDQGEASGDYLNLYYKMEDKIVIVMERRICKETATYKTTEAKVEKVQVNGHEAALQSNSVDWESNGAQVTVIAKGFSRSELLELANAIG